MPAKPKSKKPSVVIWPIDVFDDHSVYASKICDAVASIQTGPTELRLTYILDFVAESQLPQISAGTHRKWKSHFGQKARERMDLFLKSLNWSGPLKGEILTKGTQSRRQSVDLLLKHAKQKKAQMIVAGTHARKGLKRVLLGSFAETLVTSAKLPILVVSPESKVTKKVQKIVFATDFSKTSQKGFKETLLLAKALGAQVVLFHKTLSTLEPVIQSGVYMLGGGWVSTAQFLDDDQKAKSEMAVKWVADAKKMGVSVDYVSAHPDLGIAEAVCETAKQKNADLIVVLNQTGRWATVLLGSISREVLRQSPTPVMILHTT